VIRITIRGNMRPPSELRRMIRGGGWDSEGFRRKYFLSSRRSYSTWGSPLPCPWTNGMVAAKALARRRLIGKNVKNNEASNLYPACTRQVRRKRYKQKSL